MKKKVQIIFITALIAVLLIGCSGGKEDSSNAESVTSESDPEQVFNEAMKKFADEKIKAMETKSTTYYDDSTEEEEEFTCIFDTEKNMIERVSKDPDGIDTFYECFNVKEKDGYGVYINDELTAGEWQHYTEELEEDEEGEYDYWRNEFDLALTEEKGYSDVRFSNEGEDEINGEKMIKIRATAYQLYDSGIESVGEISRKSILEEYGWTEEEVALVEGFSKTLDDYVEARAQSEGESKVKCILTVWIDAKDRTIQRSRLATQIESEENASAKEALRAFDEDYWMVDMIHQEIEDGISPKDAKADLEAELKDEESMEENTAEDTSDGEETDKEFEEEAEDYASVTKTVVIKNFSVGKECPEMDAFPEDVKEVTQDEYFEGSIDHLGEEAEETDEEYTDDFGEGFEE